MIVSLEIVSSVTLCEAKSWWPLYPATTHQDCIDYAGCSCSGGGTLSCNDGGIPGECMCSCTPNYNTQSCDSNPCSEQQCMAPPICSLISGAVDCTYTIDPELRGTFCDDGVYCTKDDKCTLTGCEGTPRDCGANAECSIYAGDECICKEGFSDCNTLPNYLNCVDFNTDRNNCGSCNSECNSSQACVDGQCITTPCNNGLLDDGEECDSVGGLFGETCAKVNLYSGTPTCKCPIIDYSSCHAECNNGHCELGENSSNCLMDCPIDGWIAQTAGISYTEDNQIKFTSSGSMITDYSFDVKANTDYTLSFDVKAPLSCEVYVDFDDEKCLSADNWLPKINCFDEIKINKDNTKNDWQNVDEVIQLEPNNDEDVSLGYLKQLHLKINVNCNGEVFIDDISLKETQYLNDDVYYDNLSANIDSTSGCCPSDWCWDGNQCVNSLLWMDDSQKAAIWNLLDISNTDAWPNEHIYTNNQTMTRGYRCVLDENESAFWSLSTIKYDWNYETSGYCPKETDCFVNKEFNGGTSGDDCIKDGESIGEDNEVNGGNHFCYKGNWTTKSYIIATELEKLTEGQDFVLFCDNETSNVFNNLGNQQIISSSCTLIKNKDTVITGFALRNEEDFNTPLTSTTTLIGTIKSQYSSTFGEIIFDDQFDDLDIPASADDCELLDSTGYLICLEVDNLKLYYNPEGKYFLLSNKNVEPLDLTTWQTFWKSISDFFKNMFGIETNKDYNYINSVSTYDKIYLMNSTIDEGKVFVKGTHENKYDEYDETNKNFMYIKYENTINNTLNVKYINDTIAKENGYLNYTNTSTYQQIVIISPETSKLWEYLTAMLRDR